MFCLLNKLFEEDHQSSFAFLADTHENTNYQVSFLTHATLRSTTKWQQLLQCSAEKIVHQLETFRSCGRGKKTLDKHFLRRSSQDVVKSSVAPSFSRRNKFKMEAGIESSLPY